MMNLIIYLPGTSEKGRRLLDDMRQLHHGINLEVFDTAAGFVRRLRQPKDDSLIVVLFDPTHEDLEGLRNVREFLVNVPLLLVLSDQDVLTMALAHRLLPSYITYVDSDMAQLFSVIRKLLPAGQEARKA
jgi:hypothetical protein